MHGDVTITKVTPDTDQGQDAPETLLPVVVAPEQFVNRSDVGYALTKMYLELAETAAEEAHASLSRTIADAVTPKDLIAGLLQTQRDLERALRIAEKAQLNSQVK